MADGMQNLPFSSSLNGGEKPSHVLNGNQEELLSSLMAKLRTTSQQIKTWSDTSRKLRTVMAKCQEPATVDADRLQLCLDQLKLAIKGSMSLPAMLERLKTHAKQAGLKFHTSQNSREVFISSDVFFVEVMLESSGAVEYVKICDQDESISCPEMRDCLRESNFKGFLDHLKGLNTFYQLSCEVSVKRDAFKCLQTLEDDLKKVFKISCLSTTNVMVLILKGLVGFVTPRIGGYPMRLTFFVSPYDLLNVEKKTSTVLNMSDPLPEDKGMSLSVTVDASATRKLQSSSTLNVVSSTDGKKGPHYNFVQLNNSNCMNIPACFILKLNKPMPLSIIQIKRLAINQNITSAVPLNSLICRHAQDLTLPADNKPTSHNKFYVTLPGEQHCYFISESNKDMKGVMQSTIPLTCTSQAIAIVTALRQQAAYNTLIASCVRSDTCKDESEVSLFEVSTVTQYKLTITFEHPAKIGMACVEMDMIDVSNAKCVIHTPQGEEPLCSNDYATKVLQKCMSIPVTMRAIMKVAFSKMDKFRKPMSASAVPSMFSPGSANVLQSNMGKGVNGTSQKTTSTTMSYINNKMGNVRPMPKSILRDLSQSMVTLFGPSATDTQKQDLKSLDDSKVSQNPMLASLLQNTNLTGATATKPPQNPMLMDLLRVQVAHGSPSSTPSPKMKEVKQRRKRKSTSDSRSPRQFGDDLIDDPVFFPPGTPNTATHQISIRYPSVPDMSAVMPGGSSELKFSFTGDILNNSADYKQKRIESTSSQGSSSWPVLSPLTPTPWPTNRTSGTRSTLDTPENDMIMQGDIPSTPVEKMPSASFPEHGTTTITPNEIPENVPLNFFTEALMEDNFPEIDPDVLNSEVNFLESGEEGSSFDLVNMTLEPNNTNRNSFTSDFIDYKPKVEKGQLSSSYPLQSSGKPSLMSRRKSSEVSLTSVMDLDLPNIDIIKEKKPLSTQDTMKQPFFSKGKPKNFKPDSREGSMSPQPSPHPPKKAKRKTRRKETNNSPPTVEHPKKTRKKRKLEHEDEPQSKVSFTMTASSDPLKIKLSRIGSEPKKQTQLTPEPRKVSPACTDIKPATPKITFRLAHPPPGEIIDGKSSEPEPKKEPDKRSLTEKKGVTTGNVGEILSTTKPTVKAPNIEKRKLISTEQTSKPIGVRTDTKQNPPLNKTLLNQRTSRDTPVMNQKGVSVNEGRLQTGVKKVITIQKPGSSTTKTALAKKLAAQKAKFGSMKTISSKPITQGQLKSVSLTSPPNASSKQPSNLVSAEITNKMATCNSSNIKSTSVATVSKPVSSTKLTASKPSPLVIMQSQSSNVASPKLGTTPNSGTPMSAGAAALKKNKLPFRSKTISSIVEVLQMKAQKNKGEHDPLSEDVNETQRPAATKASDTPTSRTQTTSSLKDTDRKSNILSKAPVVKPQKPKVSSVMPSKSQTYSSKPGTPKTFSKTVNQNTKFSAVPGRSSSTSSPKQSKMCPNLPRSLSTSNPSNKITSPASNKVPQKIGSPSKTLNVQKSPSSPMKTLGKTSTSPSSVQRKPNILSKSPKLTASPKSKVLGPTTKVTSPSHLIRHGSEGNKKPTTVARTTSSSNSSINNVSSKTVAGESPAKTTNTINKVEKVTSASSVSSDVRKPDSQLTKKADSSDITKLNNAKSDTNKSKEETGETKEVFRKKVAQDDTAKHTKLNTDAKKELSQKKVEVDMEKYSKDILNKSSGSPFRIPSPAVLTNSMSPKPLTPKPVLKVPSPKSFNVAFDQKSHSQYAKSVSQAKEETITSGKSEDVPVNLKKTKPVSPVGDAESDSELIIDDLLDESIAETEKKQLIKNVQPVNASSDTQTESGSTSPRSMIVQSPLGIMACSPLGQVASPLMLPAKSPAALSCPSNQASPCPIDDDLMDEALVPVISKEDN